MATRGRGRPKPKANVSQQQERKPKAPRNIEELSTYLVSLNESNLSNYGSMFGEMVLEYAQSEDRLTSSVNLIFETIIESRDNAPLGAKVCQKIIGHLPSDTEEKKMKRNNFRKQLMSKFQLEYKNKETTRQVSIEKWLSIFSFLCEVFRYIYINDEPIVVVGKAILSTMEWLLKLEDVDSDEVECICEHLKTSGKVLESINKDQVAAIIALLRTKVISLNSSCKVRCIALEIIELRAFGWPAESNELDSFYMDAIADAVCNDELSLINT